MLVAVPRSLLDEIGPCRTNHLAFAADPDRVGELLAHPQNLRALYARYGLEFERARVATRSQPPAGQLSAALAGDPGVGPTTRDVLDRLAVGSCAVPRAEWDRFAHRALRLANLTRHAAPSMMVDNERDCLEWAAKDLLDVLTGDLDAVAKRAFEAGSSASDSWLITRCAYLCAVGAPFGLGNVTEQVALALATEDGLTDRADPSVHACVRRGASLTDLEGLANRIRRALEASRLEIEAHERARAPEGVGLHASIEDRIEPYVETLRGIAGQGLVAVELLERSES